VFKNTYEWCAKGISSEIDNLQAVPFEVASFWLDLHTKGKNWVIPDTNAIEDSKDFKEILQAQGIKSLITFPMMVGKKCLGCIGFDSVRKHKVYSENEEDVLMVFSQMLVNITERRKAEQKLLNSEANLAKAKEKAEENENRLLIASKSAQLGIFDWNLQENTLIWDDRMFELYGQQKEMTESTFELWVTSLHPADKEKAIKDLNDALEGIKEFDTTFRIKQPTGKELHIKADGLILRDKEGNAKRMIGVNLDITEAKTKELILESQNRQLVDFSNIVAHNLRSPLVNIEMLIDFFEKSNEPEEQSLLMGKLKSVVVYLKEIFNELMETVQVRQDIEIASEKIVLEESLNKILNGLESQINSYDATIKVDFTAAPIVYFPKKYIDSIFLNLLSNTLKYKSPDKKPIIHIKTKKSRIMSYFL